MGHTAPTQPSGVPETPEPGDQPGARDLEQPRAAEGPGTALTPSESRLLPGEKASLALDLWCRLASGPSAATRPHPDVPGTDLRAAERPEAGLTVLPEVGDEFLGFCLIGELGRGAFGRVYLARQGELADRPVALKVSSALCGESQTLARLQHTNIVPIHSVHRAGPLQAVCMPYCGSTTLKDVYDDLEDRGALPRSGQGLLTTLLHQRSRSRWPEGRRSAPAAPTSQPEPGSAEAPAELSLPPPAGAASGLLRYLAGLSYVQAVLWVGSRLTGGLAHAHERGIFHRDLKPANILLSDEGQPMLLDFNLAADLQARPDAAAGGGTLYYMAPEQLTAFGGRPRPADARSDLYALGLILYELLTGRHPFAFPDGPLEIAIYRLRADRLGPPPAVRPWNPAVTPAAESIVRRCLEPDPARRYQAARELQEDLERHLADRPLRYAPEPSPRERLAKWSRRHPTLTSSTTISALGLILIGSLLALGELLIEDYRGARAQLRRSAFRANFETCQLLLNTYTEDGAPEQLARGVRLARRALDGYGVDGPGDWTARPAVRYLAGAERRALRAEVSELVQLEARARILLTQRASPGAELRRALQQGVARLDTAQEFDPCPPAALFADRARFLDLLGRHDRAARDRIRAAQLPPESARDHYLLGTSLLARGEADRAELLLNRAVTLDPRRFWAWFALGICHSDQGRHSDAVYDFGVSTTLAPRFAWPHLNRGLSLARSGRLAEARVAYTRALELDPAFAEARVDRALAGLELNDPAAALRDLDRARALGRSGRTVLLARAEALVRLGRAREADRAYAELIRTHAADPLPLVARGFAHLTGDPAGAAADFAQALDLDPHQARARLGQAYLLRRDDPRAALALVESALAEEPDFGDALQLRALLRARLGQPGAETDVDRLLQAPTPQRLYNAACVLALLARRDADPRLIGRALDLLRRALDAGLPPAGLTEDPDLEAVRASPRFARLIGPTAKEIPPGVTGHRPR